ncbi:hypothetical protein TIFTF001_008646 [Ficus carica]|uniref:TF-B3 domain-containing protein n=1 Tax=Ficus carica TaxID=3494 RepID=A0AA87ZV81_FICCA|nr:hypothetical protein TIFTF001_008646 [Ficus carica]
MDNINISSLSSSTPHKPHYIPEFYHHHHYNHQIPPQEHPSPMSSTYNPSLTFNLIQDENDIDDPDQNDERQQPLPPQQNLNDDDDKEPMFEKPLTPSDVGKLNRLVIPKQHAEKYFPLGGGGGGGGESGLLLSFEDELGKFWRFRYSYWNSSQSYVLTKGWSRYVKEKRLDAGDVVLFERHRRDGDRLFIGWRRQFVWGIQHTR